jgi:hypothetical protein
MVEGIFQIVYVSSAVREFSDAELSGLLAKSRTNNAACGITGMLVYADGNFLQVLEGPKEDVLAAYLRIHDDPRHRGVIKLLEKAVPCRYFPQWSMGFDCIDKSVVGEIPGYQQLRTLSVEERASTAHRLIGGFVRRMTGVA